MYARYFTFTFISIISFLINRSVWCLNGPALYQVTPPVDHGEGPTWDGRTGLLYFVNIFEGQILSYNPKTSALNSITIGHDVTPVIPTKSNPHVFIVGQNRSVLSIEWDGKNSVGAVQKLTEISQQFPTSRFNDGKADRKGRLWFGTMGFEGPAGVTPDEGVLYLINRTNIANPLPVIRPVNISNGMAWNKANNKFYYIDTLSLRVVEYNYDNVNGEISSPRVAFDLTNHPNISGFPDGMTIDKDDNLWIALYWGGAVIKVNPKTGDLLQKIAIPAACVSSVSWGGRNLDILFVTTSRHALTDVDKSRQPAAGSLFAIKDLGTHGLPAYHADIL